MLQFPMYTILLSGFTTFLITMWHLLEIFCLNHSNALWQRLIVHLNGIKLLKKYSIPLFWTRLSLSVFTMNTFSPSNNSINTYIGSIIRFYLYLNIFRVIRVKTVSIYQPIYTIWMTPHIWYLINNNKLSRTRLCLLL